MPKKSQINEYSDPLKLINNNNNQKAALKDRNMQPLGLGSTWLLTGGAQKSPRTLATNAGTPLPAEAY